ncbi:MAG: hypothetical protein JST93_30935 [Acidobacteria bacterium]|nr:hypothetical protein [Acidobacteriota bacterium]
MGELSPNSAPTPPSVDSLQFQTADIAEKKPACSQCSTLLENEYYQLAGADICPACANAFQTGQQRPKQTWVMQGFLYGLGAAIGCSIVYAAIVWITNFELSLMAIVVGYVVGKAVLRGARGLGGRRCQMVAVALTYFSITTSYLPLMFKAFAEKAESEAKAAQKGKPPANPVRVEEVKQSREPMTAGGLAVGVGVLLVFSMVAPFFGITEGFNGMLGLFIIFIGLHQAWKLTARDERLLMGPYQREENDSAGTIA